MINTSSENKKGQVVLFIVILITISLIIATSIVTRSLTGQRNITLNTDSARAFSAAESGIDELLNRGDLAQIAGPQPTPHDISAVDRSLFSLANYDVTESNPGYFGLISKDSLVQVDFSEDLTKNPTNLKIYFGTDACVLLSFINQSYVVSRRILCGNAVPSTTITDSEGLAATNNCLIFGGLTCSSESIPFVSARTLLVKVLVADSKLGFSANNLSLSFLTKNIIATSRAETKSGVKKEIQVSTKTTKDIYPVFDYALYIR